MSEIKVNCPECKSSVILDSQELNRTQGRASCSECGNVFQLTKKPKKRTPVPEPRHESHLESHLDDVLMYDNDTIVLDNLLTPADAPADDSIQDLFQDLSHVQTEQHDMQPETSKPAPLVYRIPKADDGKLFAEVQQEEPISVNFLDRDSISTQLPQVSIKDKTHTNTPVSDAVNVPQQNNITIHTDSLVFTLIGDGQSPVGANHLTTNVPSTTVAPPAVALPSPVAATSSSETNWTIAVISALIVLIMQLFYWMLMLM